jgi:N-hydroxyarylamine O-acetyltransferase
LHVSAYLDRIGFAGDPAPNRTTLAAIQRLHLLAIPYENLDVLLGRPLTLEPAAAFAKLVGRRRGGWCYEMNGLMGWALGEIGFRVTRLATAGLRSALGDAAIGGHLALRIDTPEGPLLADAGFAGAASAPFPVIAGPFSLGGRDFRLEPLEEGWWRFHNYPGAMAADFDFQLDLVDEPLMARTCIKLQTDPESGFRQNLVCHRFTPDGEVQLRGRVLRQVKPQGAAERLLASADDLAEVLANTFAIDEPASPTLWPQISARHEALFPAALER